MAAVEEICATISSSEPAQFHATPLSASLASDGSDGLAGSSVTGAASFLAGLGRPHFLTRYGHRRVRGRQARTAFVCEGARSPARSLVRSISAGSCGAGPSHGGRAGDEDSQDQALDKIERPS